MLFPKKRRDMKVFAKRSFRVCILYPRASLLRPASCSKKKKKQMKLFFPLTSLGHACPGKDKKTFFSSVIFFFFKNKFQKFLYFQLT
jgi:hypothetical protein